MANRLLLSFALLLFVVLLHYQEVEATHCKKKKKKKKTLQLFSSLPGMCRVRMAPRLGLCHTSVSHSVTQYPWVASSYGGSDLQFATVYELLEKRSGDLGDARQRMWLQWASDVIGTAAAVVIHQPTTDGAMPESASEYLLHSAIPVIPSGPVTTNVDTTLPADCCGMAAAFSLSQANSPPLLKSRIAVMIEKSLKKPLYRSLQVYERTGDVQNVLKGITTIRKFSDASETVISHFQRVSTALRNDTEASSVTHETNSLTIPMICRLLPQCKTAICIHPHFSPTRVENHLEACREAATAETATPSHFLSSHLEYVITILHFVIYVWCIQNHLCRKYWNRDLSEQGKRSVNVLRVRFSREKNHQDVKHHSSSKGPGWQSTDVLHDVIHHYWRSRHQCLSDGESHPLVWVQQCGNLQCHSSPSVRCSFCKNQGRRTQHAYTQPETAATVREATGHFNPPIIQAYPVTRFLPDPTRDPHQDLAHVGYRLATLSAIPASVPVSRVRLADAGFYSRGVNDEVTCYSCHVQYSGWTRDDNPMAIHRRLSPHCAHVLQSDTTAANATAAGADSASHGSRNIDALPRVHRHQVTASVPTYSHAEERDRSSRTTQSGHGGSVTVHEAAAPRPLYDESGSTSLSTLRPEASIPTTAAATSRSDTSSSSPPSRPGTTHSSTAPGAEPHTSSDRHPASGNTSRPSDQTSVNATGGHTGIQSAPPERRDPEPSNPQAAAANVGVSANSSTVTSATTSDVRGQGGGAANENARRPLFPRPRLELGGAVYPMYQSLESRRRSFTSWDGTRAPPLADILLSGMFYAGYADCVRCFYCGLGMKHWVVDDDVWTEHIRWRPECQYVRAVKGEDFIRAVQRRLASTNPQSSEDPNRNSSSAAAQAAPTPRPSNTAPTATATSSSAAAATTAATATTAPATASSGGSAQRTSGIGSSSSNNSSSSNSRNGTDGQSGAQAVSATRERASGTAMVTATDEQQTLAHLQAENRTLTRNSQCKACHRAPISSLLFPCGHLVVCEACAGSVRSCPLCSQRVENSARVYFE